MYQYSELHNRSSDRIYRIGCRKTELVNTAHFRLALIHDHGTASAAGGKLHLEGQDAAAVPAQNTSPKCSFQSPVVFVVSEAYRLCLLTSVWSRKLLASLYNLLYA